MIIVTGAAGFIGYQVVKRLESESQAVLSVYYGGCLGKLFVNRILLWAEIPLLVSCRC